MADTQALWHDDFLQREVQESQTSEAIKTQILADLAKAELIKKQLGDRAEIKKEYDDVRMATIGALRNLRIETASHLDEVRKSLTGNVDFTTLWKNWDISSEEFEKIKEQYDDLKKLEDSENQSLDWIDKTEENTSSLIPEIPWNLEDFTDTNFSDLSSNDAQKVLDFITQNSQAYPDYSSWWSLLDRSANNLWEINTRQDIYTAQEVLLESIYGQGFLEKWYSWDMIYTFSSERWGNITISTEQLLSEFRTQDVESWNSLALINYFKKLESNGDFNISILIEKIWAPQIIALRKLWKTENNDPNQRQAKQYFEKIPKLKWIVSDIEDIPYETILSDRDGFEKISLLFDAVPSTEQEEIRIKIRNYFSDFIYDEKDISPLKNIAGEENLSWSAANMYRYIIAEARRTVIAQETIETIWEQYTDIPEVKDIFKALVLTTLDGRGVDEEGESAFDFSGINSMIEVYNSENNTSYTLFWKEITSVLENMFSSGEALTRFSENSEKLTRIRERIETLKEEIQVLQERSEATTSLFVEERILQNIQEKKSELLKLYNLQYSSSRDIWTALEEAENQYGEIQQNIQINTLSQKSLAYVLENPKIRIYRINDTEQLLHLYSTHSEIFSDINLRNLNPKVLSDARIILEYPWKIERNDIDMLPLEILKNHDVLAKIWEQSKYWLFPVFQRIFSNDIPSQDDIQNIHTFLKLLSNSETIPKYLIPDAIQKYDATLSEEEKISTQNDTTEKVNETEEDALNTITKIIENREENENQFWKINNFLRINPYSEAINTQLVSLVNMYPDMYSGLYSIRWNDWYIAVHEAALQKDIQNFKHLSYDQKRTREYVDILFQKIGEGDTEAMTLVNEIPINDWNDVMLIYSLAMNHALEDSLDTIDPSTIQPFVEKSIRAYENTSPQRKVLVFQRDDEKKVYDFIMKYNDLQNNITEIGNAIENEREEVSNVVQYIQNNDTLTIEQKNTIQGIIETSKNNSKFVDAFSLYIISLELSDEQQNEIIQWMLMALNNDLENQKEEASNTPATEEERQDYNEWFREDTNALNAELVEERYFDFVASFWEEIQWMEDSEIQEAFLQKYDIRPDHDFAKRIQNFLQADREQKQVQEILRNYPNFSTALRNGTLEEYRQDLRRRYYAWEIAYMTREELEEVISNSTKISNLSEVPSPFTSEYISGTPENPSFIIGETAVPITQEDLKALNNPEAEKNFIEFYQTLIELNLEEFWQYKDIIFKTISNSSATSGLNLNDAWYIDQSDMALFLYTIADSVSDSPEFTNGEQNDIQSLRGQKQDFNLIKWLMQRINKQNSIAEGGDESIMRNEWRIWRIFREMFFSKQEDKNAQSLIFNQEKFQSSLWN